MKNKRKGFFNFFDGEERIAIIYFAFLLFMFLFAIIGTIIEGVMK